MSNEKNTTKEKVVRRQFTGEVVSVAADKTISVAVKTRKMHPKYKKQYTTIRKYPVHDEKNTAKVDDSVLFEECRPISKTKRWRFIKVM